MHEVQMASSLYCYRKWLWETLKLMLELMTVFLAGKYLMPSFMYSGVEKEMKFYALSSLFLEELSDE